MYRVLWNGILYHIFLYTFSSMRIIVNRYKLERMLYLSRIYKANKSKLEKFLCVVKIQLFIASKLYFFKHGCWRVEPVYSFMKGRNKNLAWSGFLYSSYCFFDKIYSFACVLTTPFLFTFKFTVLFTFLPSKIDNYFYRLLCIYVCLQMYKSSYACTLTDHSYTHHYAL